MLISLILYITINFWMHEDLYFLLAMGREILKSGPIDTNIWTAAKGLYMPIQTWVYDAILALIEPIGNIGFFLFLVIQLTGLFFVIYKISMIRTENKQWSILVSLVTTVSMISMISIRPEVISHILVFIEIYAIEKYKKTDNKKWILILPLTTLIEANVHSSLLILHFLIIIAYCFPCILKKTIIDDSLIKKYKIFVPVTMVMFGFSFINPYGADNVFYFINSMMDVNVLAECSLETKAPSLISYNVALSLFVFACLIFLAIRKKLGCTTLYLSVGFCIMALVSWRSSSLIAFCVPFIASDIFEVKPNLFAVLKNKKVIVICMFIITICFTALSVASIQNIIIKKYDYQYTEVIDILDKAGAKKIDSIYTASRAGSFLEYVGYNNIYIDCRNELYLKRINKKENIAAEFSSYCVNGYKDNPNNTISVSDMNKFIDKYNFKYFVAKEDAANIFNFLKTQNRFKLIGKTSTGYYVYATII